MNKLYLKGYKLNTCKGLKYLYEIIKQNDGYIVSSYKKAFDELITIYHYDTKEKLFETYFESYISFVIDNNYYYLQIDRNPFFEDFYQKMPIDNMQIKGRCYLTEIKTKFFDYEMTESEIKQAAFDLYNFLINCDCSEKYIERHKKRVSNIYNNGYHYEYIAESDEIVTLNKIELI